MKKLNKKGFTLIELLAVIVVLAILMLVAVQNIFPMIANARANSFISTVENIRDSANNKYVSDMLTTITRGQKCYTVAQLVKQSYVSVDDNSIFGAVCVKEGESGNSEFQVLIYDKNNGYLYHTGLNGTKSTPANPLYIQTSASTDTNVGKYFFDVNQGLDLSGIFKADGIYKPGTTTAWTAAGIPCYGVASTGSGTPADTNVNKCISAGNINLHHNK